MGGLKGLCQLESMRAEVMHIINIAQHAYCSRDIYFQLTKVRRSIILRAVILRRYESASTTGCQECTTMYDHDVGEDLNNE